MYEKAGMEIAIKGLALGAIKLRTDPPFTWASGYQMPIYNDNRMFLGDFAHRDLIRIEFQEIIKEEGIEFDVIAGTSTAGIPHADTLANAYKMPEIYIRDKPKDHGLRNQIEGIDAEDDLQGRKVIVIEDLISTGGSSARAVQAVRDANGDCNWCLSIFNYGLGKADEAFASLDPKCNVRSLLNYDTLLEVAKSHNYITTQDLEMLEEWRADPFGWGEKHGFPQVKK